MTDEKPLLSFRGELSSTPPQRYLVNHSRYVSRGGNPRLAEDLEGYLSSGENNGDLARFYSFSLAFDQIVKEGLRGDFVELGVYKGSTATLLASYARRLGVTAYLLDTFEGFSQRDLIGIDEWAKQGAFNDTSLDAVRKLVGEHNVKFIKGFFPETAGELPEDGEYCFVHIDCDLYAPVRAALEYFYPRLVAGGFLIVHDYSSLCWDGAEKAVDEFFADKPECPLPLPDGAGSVVIRRARVPGRNDSWIVQKRRAALRTDWTGAAHGQLAELLGSGWSSVESWGVWGVGDKHVMHLALPFNVTHDLELEMDVAAVVTPARTKQIVKVAIDDQVLAEWTFELDRNRAIRNLRIPKDLITDGAVSIAFQPQSVKPACEISLGSEDKRCLGLGFHRIRLRDN